MFKCTIQKSICLKICDQNQSHRDDQANDSLRSWYIRPIKATRYSRHNHQDHRASTCGQEPDKSAYDSLQLIHTTNGRTRAQLMPPLS